MLQPSFAGCFAGRGAAWRVEEGLVDRKLNVGDTLGEVFSTYGAQAGVLLPVAFWLFLVVAIVNGLIATNLVLIPIGLAFSVIAATLYQGMVVGLVRDVQSETAAPHRSASSSAPRLRWSCR